MTFLELQTLVLTWLDDVNAGYFTLPQIKRWINNAQTEVQKLLLQAGDNYYLDCVQTSLVVNQQEYVLPNDFMKLHRLVIVTSGTPPNQDETPIAPITLNQQDMVPSHTGQPQFYSLKRNRLVLYPAPDTIYPLKLFYSPKVIDMILDNEVPDVPEHYQEFIAVLATLDGLLKDGRQIEPMMVKKNYYEAMLKADAEERTQDAPRSVVLTGEGAGYTYGYW